MEESPALPDALKRVAGIELADAGTRLTGLMWNGQRDYHATHRTPAPPSPDEAVAHIHALIQRLAGDAGILPAALGIAVAGRVDAHEGIIHALRYAPGWDEYPLASRLRQTRDIPIHLDSVTNAAALAEAVLGAGAPYQHVLYVLLARSVTVSLVSHGQLLHGAHGAEGMLAHMRVRDDGPRCSCGARGHVEPLASAQAIVRNMIGRASGSDESTAAMLRVSAGRAEAMSAAQVARLAAQGEPAAAAVIADALNALVPALASATALLDPDVIIVGGPLTQAGPEFFEGMAARVGEACHTFTQPPPILAGSLEPSAVPRGACLLADGAATIATANGAL